MACLNWWNLNLPENALQEITKAFQERHLSYGPRSELLEKKLSEILNVEHVMMTTSCSTSLLVALKVLNIGPGDEVIVPNRSFVAAANAVNFLGASLVLADVEPNHGLMDIDDILSKVTSKTKAIIPVHLNGKGFPIADLKEKLPNHINVIEDAAQALFSKSGDNFLGTEGDMGCFSLGVTKFMTSGQGGFVVTNNTEFAKKSRHYLKHGFLDEYYQKPEGMGFNFRQSDLLSAIALSQLDNWEEKKKRFLNVYREYEEGLKAIENVELFPVAVDAGEIPIWIEVFSSNRASIIEKLKDAEIESKPFHPSIGDDEFFPNSRKFAEQGLLLPSGPDLESQDIQRVLSILNE